MNLQSKSILTVILFVLMGSFCFAIQVAIPEELPLPMDGEDPSGPPGLYLDSFLVTGVVAGIVYGIKKLLSNNS
ncbi:hypothetical protein [Gaetbulibacter saemankumensis]|uniref:hypothetical protein n=1 Tax=Gaetbulibacter saemankumensis TaxID=311208 RepID=UPI0004284981|nr:hypothetical protein [Gaetbulibacter saemankumensis]